MKKNNFYCRILCGFTSLLILFSLTAHAETGQSKINEVLQLKDEPAGVVFEIDTGQKDGLEWALPMVKKHISQLKARFPELDIAIVTHGREQFALQNQKKQKNKKVHSLTQQLVGEDVQLHVCGTHAEWRGVSEEDFPEYVDVAVTGPAQINDYVAIGYILVKVTSRT